MYMSQLKHIIKLSNDTVWVEKEGNEIIITTFPLSGFRQSIIISDDTRVHVIEALRCLAKPTCYCED